MQNKPISLAIQDAIASREDSTPLLVVFADSGYLEVLLNWLVSIDRIGLGNYLVFSLDSDLDKYLQCRNIPSVLLPYEKGADLGGLWELRTEVFKLLCDLNIDFVHSDADAVWFRDPVTQYFMEQKSDLVMSQGTIWPPFVLKVWSFVLCCGLFYVRSSPLTRALFEDLLTDIRASRDDQVSINKVLMERGIQWELDRSQLYKLQYDQHDFLCSKNIVHGVSLKDDLTVSMLPHHLFQRLPMQVPEVYVRHLLTPKRQSKKMEAFAASDCLFLNPDWKSIDYDGVTLQRIGI